MLLRHGTTRKRANAILLNGPDVHYREFSNEKPDRAFSTAPVGGPFHFGDPEEIARSKAEHFPKEGGPAILEFELPDELAAEMIGDIGSPWAQGKASDLDGEIRFEPGYGLEKLLNVWSQLKKKVIPLTDR